MSICQKNHNGQPCPNGLAEKEIEKQKNCEHLYRDASDKRFCIDCGKDMSKDDKFQADIRKLRKLAEKIGLKIACDEEWNTIFTRWDIQLDRNNKPIIFGFSGSEEEDI